MSASIQPSGRFRRMNQNKVKFNGLKHRLRAE
jgi:hypothetical protein